MLLLLPFFVSAMPVPSQPPPSCLAPPPHADLRKRRKSKVRPELYPLEIRDQTKFERKGGPIFKSKSVNIMGKALTVWLTYSYSSADEFQV